MDIGTAVLAHARNNPGATAAFEGDRTQTYGELDERSNRIAHTLISRYGVRPGDRVAVLLRNRLEVAEVLVGVIKAGGVYCGLNFRMSEDEYRSIVENCGARVIITENQFRDLAHSLRSDEGPLVVLDVDDDGDAHYGGVARGSAEPPATVHSRAADDEFCIVYSSGTTGSPKGIVFDSRAVSTHAMVAAMEYEMSPSSRWLITIPHNSSVQITLAPTLFLGGAVGFLDGRGFDPEAFAAESTRQRATHTYLVPTMLYRMLDAGLDATALPTMTSIGYGAAPITPDRVGELVTRFGPVFSQLYGMAEVASIATMLRREDHRKIAAGHTHLAASAGRPSYLMDVRVIGDTASDVHDGRGEITFRAPYIMRGYNRAPEKTAATLVDGWVHSGDIGRFDDEGYLYVVDRMKDLIIRGGYNITPSEIENALYTHPAVLEAAVVGLPDREWGESLLAAVAFRTGATASPEEIQAHCRAAGLPSIKIPERVLTMDSLPKNAVGKIAKRNVVDIALGNR